MQFGRTQAAATCHQKLQADQWNRVKGFKWIVGSDQDKNAQDTLKVMHWESVSISSLKMDAAVRKVNKEELA